MSADHLPDCPLGAIVAIIHQINRDATGEINP